MPSSPDESCSTSPVAGATPTRPARPSWSSPTTRPRTPREQWPRTTFVDGVEAAVDKAKEIAGDKDVTIASATVTQQALELGLVDEVCVSLVPVLFGEGIPLLRQAGPTGTCSSTTRS